MKTITWLKDRASFPVNEALRIVELSRATWFRWAENGGRKPTPQIHPPKSHYLLEAEKQAIVEFKRAHPEEGYRRLSFMMIDEKIAAVSPASVHRVLQEAGLSSRWTQSAGDAHRKGFIQPTRPHEQWHTDIAYINVAGTHYFFISVLDGFSRSIVHHEVRQSMETRDVEIVVERALEKLPAGSPRPRMISDNGPQYISWDFKAYLRDREVIHSRARANHPQSNGKLERFHGSLKRECVRREPLTGLEAARRTIAAYVEHYNTKRLHSALNYLTPWDYLQGAAHIQSRLMERRTLLDEARERRRQARRNVTIH